MKVILAIAVLCLATLTFGQTKASAVCPDDKTDIVSIRNLASGGTTLSPGVLARIVWCDLEFPTPTTPISSVSVHDVFAPISYVNLTQTTASQLGAYHGYPGFAPREVNIQLPNSGVLLHNPIVKILRNGEVVGSAEIEVEDYAPGLYTVDRKPKGPVMARNAAGYIGGNNLVYVGDIIAIYAGGLGPTTPFVLSGVVYLSPPAVTVQTPEVIVGGQSAVVITSKLVQGTFFNWPSLMGIYEPKNGINQGHRRADQGFR